MREKLKKNRFIVLSLLVFAFFGQILQVNAQEKTATGYFKTLTWSDEFNIDGPMNSKYWNYEIGYVRNKKTAKQYYTSRPENVRLENGKLIIEERKESYEGYDYTSADVTTKNKVSISGDFRIEVRAKLPKGGGVWPAIWMMGENGKWPACSELDIMEYVGNDPSEIFATMHWLNKDTGEHKKNPISFKVTDSIHSNFNVYALERVGSNIKVFFNNNIILNFEVPSTSVDNSFTQPLFLLLNYGLGGHWPGPVDDAFLPQKYEFDYVRVYALSKTVTNKSRE